MCSYPGCLKSFKAHGHLKDHEKMHTRSRPYKCEVCYKSYGRSGILKNHMKTHLMKIDSLMSYSKFDHSSQCSHVNVDQIIYEPSEITFEGNFTNKLPVLNNCENSLKKKNLIRIEKTDVAPLPKPESNLNFRFKNLANITHLKEEDENITISSSINVNEDRTPVNLEQIRSAFSLVHQQQALQAQQLQNNQLLTAQMLDMRNSMKTEGLDLLSNKLLHNIHASGNSTKENYSKSAPGVENISQNYNSSLVSSNKYNLSKIPKSTENNPITEFNFMTPKNVNYTEDTPSNQTPTSKLLNRIKKLINSGQDTMNLEEATSLYNFYYSNLSKFQHLNRNEQLEKKFTSIFEDYVHNSFKSGQNLSLQKILQLLETLVSPATENMKSKIPQGQAVSQLNFSPQVSLHSQSNNINNLSSEHSPNLSLLNSAAQINNFTSLSNLANIGNISSLNNTINNLTSLNTLANLNSLNNLNNFNQLNNLATLNTLNTLSTLNNINNLNNLNNLNNGLSAFNPIINHQVSSDISNLSNIPNINNFNNVGENSPVFSFTANNLGALSPLFAHNLLSNPNTTQNITHKNSMSMDRSASAQNINKKMITFSDYFNSFNNN